MQQFFFLQTSLSTSYFFVFKGLAGLCKLELIKCLEASCQMVLVIKVILLKYLPKKNLKAATAMTNNSLLHLPAE